MAAVPKHEIHINSGVEWLGEIPKHWHIKKLKFCCKNNACTLSESTDSELQIRYVDIGSVSQGKIEKVEYHTFKDAPSRARRIANSGDTIVSTVRTYLKSISYVEEEYADCIFSTGFSILSPYDFFDSKFFSYFLQSELFIDEVVRHSKGVSFPAITSLELGNFSIVIPPTNEQIRIADFLDLKTAEIDQAIAQKQRLIELLQEQKAILINKAVTKGLNPNTPMRDSGIEWLGEIPEHWQVTRLKRLFLEIDDRSTDGSETLLSLRMYAGLVPHDDVSDKPIEDTALAGYKRVYPGQIVMNRMRAAIGLFGVATIFGIVSPDYAIFRQVKELKVDYYLNLFKTELMKKEFLLESKGLGTGSSGFLRLYSDKFGMIKVPFPPLEEQTEIWNHIQKIDQEFSKVLEKSDQEIDLLKELKNIVVSQAVTGKIKI
jgi:type I restriction enzyme, S subunit